MTVPLTPPPQQLSYAQLEALWIQAGGDPTKAPMAAAVALAESGGWTSGPHATNVNSGGSAPGSVDRGLWQINSFYHPTQSVYDPLTNAKGAIIISQNGRNWRPWCSAWSNNDCTGTYLGQGSHAVAHLTENVAPSSSLAILTSATNPTATGSSGSPNAPGVGDECAWQLSLPVAGSFCVFSKVFLREASGWALMLIGGGGVLFGIALIAAFTFGGVAAKTAIRSAGLGGLSDKIGASLTPS